MNEPAGTPITDLDYVDALCEKAGEWAGVEPDVIRLGRQRGTGKEAAHARASVWTVLCDTGWSYSRVGRVFDRNHSTVWKVVDQLRELGASEPNTAALLVELRRVPRANYLRTAHLQEWETLNHIIATVELRINGYHADILLLRGLLERAKYLYAELGDATGLHIVRTPSGEAGGSKKIAEAPASGAADARSAS